MLGIHWTFLCLLQKSTKSSPSPETSLVCWPQSALCICKRADRTRPRTRVVETIPGWDLLKWNSFGAKATCSFLYGPMVYLWICSRHQLHSVHSVCMSVSQSSKKDSTVATPGRDSFQCQICRFSAEAPQRHSRPTRPNTSRPPTGRLSVCRLLWLHHGSR